MLTRGRWVILLAAVVSALTTARLGLWQLDRARQKTEVHDRMIGRAALSPLAATALARSAQDAAEQHYRQITLRGRWLAERTVFLDNRQMNGRVGFFVVTPLQIAPGEAVLVQRGWVPRNALDRSALPAVPTPDGEVQVSGRIVPPPGRLFELGAAEAGRIRQNLDIDAFAREVGIALRPLSLQQTDAARPLAAAADAASTPASPADDGLLRQWPAATLDVSKHHGYAFQWFALSALITGLYVWFQILRPRR